LPDQDPGEGGTSSHQDDSGVGVAEFLLLAVVPEAGAGHDVVGWLPEARSVALAGFGLDSLIDIGASTVV
jgi:hypothetical protein